MRMEGTELRDDVRRGRVDAMMEEGLGSLTNQAISNKALGVRDTTDEGVGRWSDGSRDGTGRNWVRRWTMRKGRRGSAELKGKGFLATSAAPSETNEELVWEEQERTKSSEHSGSILGSTGITVVPEYGANYPQPLGPK
jgi:hypothetical protein